MSEKIVFNPLAAAGLQRMSTTAESFAAATLEPTGFEDNDNIGASYSYADRKVTLTHSSGTIAWWFRGKRYTTASPWTSAAHTATVGSWFLKFLGDVTTENWSQTPWSFSEVMTTFVNYAATEADSYALRETHGLMPWQSHQEEHQTTGTYRTSGLLLTAGTYAINGTTDAENTWGVDSGVVKDEDISTTVAAWTQGSYTLLRRDGVNGTWLFTKGATLPFFQAANTLQYNQNTGATWQLTSVPEDNFVNYYVYALPVTADAASQTHRIWVVPGQAVYTSSAAAQQEFPSNLDLGTLTALSPEFVSVTRITMRYNAAAPSPLTTTGRCNIAAQVNLTGTRNAQTATAPFTPADHGNLSGLGDDDHTQYDLIVGRAGNVVTQSADFTVSPSVILYIVDTSGGSKTVTLADPALYPGKMFIFLNNSTNNITFGSYPIGGVTNFTIDGNERLQIVSDGTAWRQYARKMMATWKTGVTFCKDQIIEVQETGFEGIWRCSTQHTAAAAFSTDAPTRWDYMGGERSARWINSTAHGFSEGNWLYDTGSAYALADCDEDAKSEVLGVVSGVTTDYFMLVTNGYYKRASGTFTRGAVQWLSATAGAATETKPSTVGQIEKPLGTAFSTTEMFVNIMRGSVVGGANAYTSISLANNATTSFFTIPSVAGDGGWISGTIKIAVSSGTSYTIPFFCHFDRQQDGTTYNVSPSFGDTIPTGLSITNSSSSVQVVMPNVTNFSSATVKYCVQAAATGASMTQSLPSNQIIWDVTALSNSYATALGLKQYFHGTNYNGGNAPTVTCAQSGFAINRAVFIPYQTQDGAWRLRFNISSSFTPATITELTITVNGITTVAQQQVFTSAFTADLANYGYFNLSASTARMVVNSSSNNGWKGSGDIELASKPTWAY